MLCPLTSMRLSVRALFSMLININGLRQGPIACAESLIGSLFGDEISNALWRLTS